MHAMRRTTDSICRLTDDENLTPVQRFLTFLYHMLTMLFLPAIDDTHLVNSRDPYEVKRTKRRWPSMPLGV
jgi:hypothetical protein